MNKFCINCKHISPLWECKHPYLQKPANPVSGKVGKLLCVDARSGRCGYDGKYFEEAPPSPPESKWLKWLALSTKPIVVLLLLAAALMLSR